VIDFHTHTFHSDGVLGPSELVRRAYVAGYKAIGLADHADGSNLELLVPAIVKVARELNAFQETFVVPGVEITHAPPAQIADLVIKARALGAVLVVVHGESPVEPVASGTNRAAIEAGVDIVAHPGLIDLEDARRAAENGVLLEITSRGGHNRTNGHVARMAKESGAGLVVNTDAHAPGDLISLETATAVLVGAGLTPDLAQTVLKNNEDLLHKLKRRLET
jgi:histidinol phosphatase-like PHP family hydrolase